MAPYNQISQLRDNQGQISECWL